MQRIIFSGGSTPSARAQSRKNLQGNRSCENVNHLEFTWIGLTKYLQPDNNQIPESNHAEFEWRIALPGVRVLDSYDVHEMLDELHGKEAGGESDQVREDNRTL